MRVVPNVHEEVRPISNVIEIAAFNRRSQTNGAHHYEPMAIEASVPAALRAQYVSLRREFSSMLNHAVVDVCLEHGLGVDISHDLASRIDGRDVPPCSQQDIVELEACYGHDLLYSASLAVDFEGLIKFQLISTESGYAAKWYHLQSA